MIRFTDVAVRYPRSEAEALRGVTLEARRGAITAVAGPNGSGKSTLIRALIGRVGLVRGEIRVNEAPRARMANDDFARQVAVITQREDLAFPVRVIDYVALGRFPHLGLWHAANDRDRHAIAEAIASAEIELLRDRRVDTLSGGEWQRVRLARALAQGGNALALDEPTAFLDIGHEMAVFELLSRLAANGQAILLVSHQLNLVARFADVMVLLHRGEVAAAGTPESVMRPDVLEHVYEWPLVVSRDPAVGAPALVPLRQRSRQ
jgi:iron complex transport system ATP-binding protein